MTLDGLSAMVGVMLLLALRIRVKDMFGFRYEDFELQNYQAHPSIRALIEVRFHGGSVAHICKTRNLK